MFVKTATAVLLGAAAFSLSASTPEIFEGAWSDGTKIEWACLPGTQGQVPVRITTPKGEQYTGMLKCGESI